MIEFENVSFAYTGQEHDGLRDINLKISDGECVLFCGRSGCGKTTITRLVNGLIPQFYQGELQGRVLCLLYTSPSPRDGATSRMPSSA